MLRLFLFTTLLFLSAGGAFGQIPSKPVDDHRHKCPDKTILDDLRVTRAGKAAFHSLVKAERFETGSVGFAGTPSAYIENYQTIMREPLAAGLFKYLFIEATAAGKLYALSGLYATDPAYFQKAADLLKKSGATVRVLDGCLMSDEEVAKIVESDAANVAIIEPGKTMKDFWESNAGAFELDIVHGGYPAAFMEFADTKVRNLK